MKLTETAPLARYVGAMLAVMFVVSSAVRAEPVFSFDATPGKLPKPVIPINYSIELREPTARLTLDAVNTTFASVTAETSRPVPLIDAWIKACR